jgi:hypothetical protein
MNAILPEFIFLLLVAKSILPSAIRALPGNSIARHSPDIFQHAILAYTEPATASPTKRQRPVTAVAVVLPGSAAFLSVFRLMCSDSLISQNLG